MLSEYAHICTVIRKLFITFLAVLYLGASSGATLHYKYCMGRLVKITLSHEQTKKCHSCGMNYKGKAAKKCCTDKHQQLKSENSSSPGTGQVKLGTSAFFLLPKPFQYVAYDCTPMAIDYPVSLSPPLVSDVPVFLRNCTFRI